MLAFIPLMLFQNIISKKTKSHVNCLQYTPFNTLNETLQKNNTLEVDIMASLFVLYLFFYFQ